MLSGSKFSNSIFPYPSASIFSKRRHCNVETDFIFVEHGISQSKSYVSIHTQRPTSAQTVYLVFSLFESEPINSTAYSSPRSISHRISLGSQVHQNRSVRIHPSTPFFSSSVIGGQLRHFNSFFIHFPGVSIHIFIVDVL